MIVKTAERVLCCFLFGEGWTQPTKQWLCPSRVILSEERAASTSSESNPQVKEPATDQGQCKP